MWPFLALRGGLWGVASKVRVVGRGRGGNEGGSKVEGQKTKSLEGWFGKCRMADLVEEWRIRDGREGKVGGMGVQPTCLKQKLLLVTNWENNPEKKSK